ncbi:MAG: EVE domain-containing protein, partial [Pseudomonadota bacterium]
IVSEPYDDPTQFDPEAKYYDPKSTPDKPRWQLVDVQFEQKFERTISLAELKMNPKLEGMRLLQRGNRLSILPVTAAHWKAILKML